MHFLALLLEVSPSLSLFLPSISLLLPPPFPRPSSPISLHPITFTDPPPFALALPPPFLVSFHSSLPTCLLLNIPPSHPLLLVLFCSLSLPSPVSLVNRTPASLYISVCACVYVRVCMCVCGTCVCMCVRDSHSLLDKIFINTMFVHKPDLVPTE